MKKFFFTVLILLFILLVVPGSTTFNGGISCLPAGPRPNGYTTAVNFLPSWHGRGRFIGIRVTELRVKEAGVRIAYRNKQVIFSGNLTVGQYIALPTHRDLIWTGYKESRGGNHGNGICVTSVYRK